MQPSPERIAKQNGYRRILWGLTQGENMMEVVAFQSLKDRPAVTKRLPVGATLYAIKCSRPGHPDMFFSWCYQDPQFAKRIAESLCIRDGGDMSANWRLSINDTVLGRH